MTVRVRYKITATVSSTSAEEKDLANQSWEIVSDTQGEGGSWKTTLPAGATDVQLYLGNLAAARLVVIRTTPKDSTQDPADIVVKKNATTGEATLIRPLEGAHEGHLLFTVDGISALYATNTGSIEMDITVVACGD